MTIQEAQRYTLNTQNLILKTQYNSIAVFYVVDENWECVMTDAGTPHLYPQVRIVELNNPDLKRV